MDQPQRGVAMSLVIPTFLSRANGEVNSAEVYRETSARLLELAAKDQTAFRAVVAGMSEGQKAFMEGIIKSGRASATGQPKTEDDEGKEPTIALRMNFGSS